MPPTRVQSPYFMDRIVGGMIVGFATCPGLPLAFFAGGPTDFEEEVRRNPDTLPMFLNDGLPYLVELMVAHMICSPCIFTGSHLGLSAGLGLGLGIFLGFAILTGMPFGIFLAGLTSVYVPLRISGKLGSKPVVVAPIAE